MFYISEVIVPYFSAFRRSLSQTHCLLLGTEDQLPILCVSCGILGQQLSSQNMRNTVCVAQLTVHLDASPGALPRLALVSLDGHSQYSLLV